jgi:hypothetical protein
MRYCLCTLLLVLCLGCSRTVEQRLGLQYVPPRVPEEVLADFHPSVGSREENLLAVGEKTINLRDKYLHGHRVGWQLAIEEWSRQHKFTYKSREDFRWDDFPSTVDAMWLGYSEARRQIESGGG